MDVFKQCCQRNFLLLSDAQKFGLTMTILLVMREMTSFRAHSMQKLAKRDGNHPDTRQRLFLTLQGQYESMILWVRTLMTSHFTICSGVKVTLRPHFGQIGLDLGYVHKRRLQVMSFQRGHMAHIFQINGVKFLNH